MEIPTVDTYLLRILREIATLNLNRRKDHAFSSSVIDMVLMDPEVLVGLPGVICRQAVGVWVERKATGRCSCCGGVHFLSRLTTTLHILYILV